MTRNPLYDETCLEHGFDPMQDRASREFDYSRMISWFGGVLRRVGAVR